MARYFQCPYNAQVSVSLSIASCLQEGGASGYSADHFRIYRAGEGSTPSPTDYVISNTLDEIGTVSTMDSDGTMSTWGGYSDQGDCDDWDKFYRKDYNHTYTVMNVTTAYTDFMLMYNFELDTESDQFTHLWNIEITCTEWSWTADQTQCAAGYYHSCCLYYGLCMSFNSYQGRHSDRVCDG